jgi:hypothetical protein
VFKRARGAAKLMRHGDALTAALAPAESVVVDAPMSGAAAAVETALAGDHRPAADLLRRTLDERAWDDRTHVVDVFALASLRAPQWLDDWQAEAPDDGGAALVRAAAAIIRAWDQRSSLRADHVTPEQFEAFHATLADATELIQRAVDLLPGDPEPWHLALVHARGLEAPREVWHQYLVALRRADQWHHAGHCAAMELVTEKWFGSNEEMYAFAHEVAAASPEGSRLRTLPLDAVFEHMATGALADAAAAPGTPEAIDQAIIWLQANVDRGHHVTAPHQNTLVFVLAHLERVREAYVGFLAVGPYATSRPWGYFGDAREVFLSYREAVVAKTAETV